MKHAVYMVSPVDAGRVEDKQEYGEDENVSKGFEDWILLVGPQECLNRLEVTFKIWLTTCRYRTLMTKAIMVQAHTIIYFLASMLLIWDRNRRAKKSTATTEQMMSAISRTPV